MRTLLKKLIPYVNFLSKLLKAVWLYITGFIAVCAIYYLLTGVEQGIDVVIQAGESFRPAVFTVLSVVCWSFLVWYSCRTLSYIRQQRDTEVFQQENIHSETSDRLYKKYGIPSVMHRHIPRLLAYNCFVSVQVAVFHLPTMGHLTGFRMFLVILFHNVLYFLISAWLQQEVITPRVKIFRYASLLLIAGYTSVLLYQLYRYWNISPDPEVYDRHKFSLGLMVLFMFAMQVLSVYLFILRRKGINASKGKGQYSRVLAFIGFNPEYNSAEATYFLALNIVSAVAGAMYIGAVFSMTMADWMGPMAFAVLALGILAGLANMVTVVSIRRSFNFFIILYALAFLFGTWRDPYTVDLLKSDSGPVFDRRPDTREFLKQWLGNRLARVDTSKQDKKFPVYIVLSDGGASRAGNWTSSVLSRLQDDSFARDSTDAFREHILAIAGASGGTVGNCAFYALLKAEKDKKIKGGEYSLHAKQFFESDFLTYTLARLLGPDIIRHLIPFNIPLDNRADALENVIARGSSDTILNEYLDKPVSQVFDTSGDLPILYINSTEVDNGMPGVISTVRLPANSQRQDILGLVDSIAKEKCLNDMRFCTAAVLSSRFPYVSPAGKVSDRYFVDGGYFDNSGAGTILELVQELDGFLKDSAHAVYREWFHFRIIHITNSTLYGHETADIHPLTNDLLAPILTLAGLQGSSTSIGDGVLKNNFRQINNNGKDDLITYSLYDSLWCREKISRHEYEDAYPMSWAISRYQLKRMQRALEREIARNQDKLYFAKD